METPKSKNLIKLEKLIGEIALLSKNGADFLVEIVSVETYKSLVKEHDGGKWYNKKYKYYDVLEPIKVWWKIVDDESGLMHSSTLSAHYDWEIMVKNADVVFSQIKQHLINKK